MRFILGRELDKSNQYMKFGINRLLNDQIKVSKSANGQEAAKGCFLAAMLVIGRETKPKFKHEQEFA